MQKEGGEKHTDHPGLLVCERGVEEDLLDTQSVARRQDDARGGHGWLAVLLLQAVGDHQERPQTDVHTLDGEQMGEHKREHIKLKRTLCNLDPSPLEQGAESCFLEIVF